MTSTPRKYVVRCAENVTAAMTKSEAEAMLGHIEKAGACHLTHTIEGCRDRESHTANEDGAVLVMFALMLTVLIGFAGFSVDLGNWYLNSSRMQTASDAAALAGAPYLPDHPATAIKVANDILRANGVDTARADVRVNPNEPTRMEVDVKRTVRNYFVSVLGITTTDIAEGASATWRPPLRLGSPSNILGNGPSTPSHPTHNNACAADCSPSIWVSAVGGATLATNGDKFSAAACGPQWNQWTASQNCANGANKPFDAQGQTYVIKVDPGVVGPLTIDLFDPVFVNTGDRCESALVSKTASTYPTEPTYAANPAGKTGPYCTGDFTPINDVYTGTEMSTTFTLSSVSGVGSPAHAVTGCSQTYGGYEFPWSYSSEHPWNGNWRSIAQDNYLSRDGYRAYSADGYKNWQFDSERNEIPAKWPATASDDELARMLAPGTDESTELDGPASSSARATRAKALQSGYRQWTPLCTLTPQADTQYVLHVTAPRGAVGFNRFAVDAHFSSDAATAAVHVYAQDRLVVYTQANTSAASFHLARIPSAARGQTLHIALWDFGDAGYTNPAPSIGLHVRAGCVADCTTSAPVPGPLLGTGSNACAYSAPLPTNRTFTDTAQRESQETFTTASSCGFHVRGAAKDGNAEYDGRDLDVRVPIPNDWHCDDADAQACWLMLDLDYGTAGYVNDTTTWQVSMSGDPIRLVNR